VALEDLEGAVVLAAATVIRSWVDLVASDRNVVQTVHPVPFGSVRPELVEGRAVAQDRPVEGCIPSLSVHPEPVEGWVIKS